MIIWNILCNFAPKKLYFDMIRWRWDQGRLLYFEFDIIKAMAEVLVLFDNMDISDCENLFRHTIEDKTGMPFAPSHYTVKRNYSRVFQCTFLANFVGNKLIVTDFCRELAKSDGTFQTVDDYFINYINRFRYPFPAFKDYNTDTLQVYPFLAIIKLLIARSQMDSVEPKATVEDIFSYLIANNVTGLEDLEYYKLLLPKSYTIENNDDVRQVREMMVFISQISFLKVYNHCVYLDVEAGDISPIINKYLKPVTTPSLTNRLEEFYSMTRIDGYQIIIPDVIPVGFANLGIDFPEGERKRVEHFRIERSTVLRKHYQLINPTPICKACNRNMSLIYGWTKYMLDIHHLLPLSNSIRINSSGTSIEDLVGLCPSCHRAIHQYYNKWLKANDKKDFRDKREAMAVYLEAVSQIA